MPTAHTHVDPDGFVITFPSTWQVRTDVSGLAVVGIVPDQHGIRDNVGVIVERTGRPELTVQQYLSGAVDLAPQSVDDFRALTRGSRTVDDRTQGVLEYTGRVRGRPRRFLAVVVVSDGRAFVATFTASESSYRQHLPAAEPVLRSLRGQ